MGLTLVVEGSSASPAAHTDDQNTMYLESREPSRSGSDSQTVDLWNGSITAARELYSMYESHSLVDGIALTQNGQKGAVRITWGVSFTEGEEPEDDPYVDPDAEVSEWSWGFIEVPAPLAAHPYFQEAYSDTGEVIEDEIARCDAAIKRGRPYTASGVYAEWTKRYYALRIAGVEEWIQYGVELVRTHAVNNVIDAQKAHDGVGKVYGIGGVAANQAHVPNIPQDVVDAIKAIDRIQDYSSAAPDDYNLTPASFEFVKRPPQCAYSVIGDAIRYDITESWVGLAKWSAVIYPDGTWDPQGSVEA